MGHIDAANGGLASPCDPATRLTCGLFRMGPAGPWAWELEGCVRGRGVPAAFFVLCVTTPVSSDILAVYLNRYRALLGLTSLLVADEFTSLSNADGGALLPLTSNFSNYCVCAVLLPSRRLRSIANSSI